MYRNRTWVALIAVATIALAVPARSLAGEDRTLSPYFFVESADPTVDRLPLQDTRVAIAISGVIADVTVQQIYKNDGKRPINARYVFPASTRAAVHGMKMIIGDHIIEAKIKERQQARMDYERAKQQGKSASLLEQHRPNVFGMNVANIMPGDRIEVELRYTELLVPTNGTYELVYPTVVGPRYSNQPEVSAPASESWIKLPYTRSGEAPRYGFELTGTIGGAVPIAALNSPSHKIKARWLKPSVADFELDASERFGGNRDFVLRYRLAGKQLSSGLLLYQGEQENFFLLMVQPPKRVGPEQMPPREYVFVVDVSGSMHGFPLDTAKRLLRRLVSGLRPMDRFNVLLFSGTSQLMSSQSLPATPSNVAHALQVIENQRGGGGTELLSALKRAMSLPLEGTWARSFVVVTDGYISAESAVFHYIRNNLNRANVFAFGIGSSVNRHLIEGVAKAGMGEPFVVLKPTEAARAAQRFLSYVRAPVLTNIAVAYEGFDAYAIEPPSIPDVFAERPVVIHGKWRGQPRGRITLTGISGDKTYRHQVDVAATQPRATNRALSHLWARTRIANLSDFAFGRQSAEQKNEITALGLKYSLLTAYTSFIAVHHVVRNTATPAHDVDQPLPMPQGVSDRAIGMATGPEPGLVTLLALLLALLAAAHLASVRQRGRVT